MHPSEHAKLQLSLIFWSQRESKLPGEESSYHRGGNTFDTNSIRGLGLSYGKLGTSLHPRIESLIRYGVPRI